MLRVGVKRPHHFLSIFFVMFKINAVGAGHVVVVALRPCDKLSGQLVDILDRDWGPAVNMVTVCHRHANQKALVLRSPMVNGRRSGGGSNVYLGPMDSVGISIEFHVCAVEQINAQLDHFYLILLKKRETG